jgi:hypothetical protein
MSTLAAPSTLATYNPTKRACSRVSVRAGLLASTTLRTVSVGLLG